MSRRDRRFGLGIALFALAGALAPAAPEPLALNKSLAQEQIKLIDQALADLDRLVKGGEMSISDPRLDHWERRRVEATRATGAGKSEMVAAQGRYVNRLRDQERWAEELWKKDQATRTDVFDVKYRRLEAEMWLNQEKAR
jgi:hypothetical protein